MARKDYLLKRYGITEEQYNELLQQQGKRCAICGKPASYFRSRLSVDHDHRTGQIRGLLCPYCNRRIVGRHRLGKGDELLRAAYEYLVREYTGWIVPPKKKRRKKKHGSRTKLQKRL